MSDASPTTLESKSVESKTAAIVAKMWVKSRPVMLERMALLERLTAGEMTPEARAEAAGIAHKFAGSLGMFGFDEGTRIGRELEGLLEAEGAVDVGAVRGLVGELRGKVFGVAG